MFYCVVCVYICVKIFNIGSIVLTYFKMHNTMLSMSTILYSRSLELAYLAYMKHYTHEVKLTISSFLQALATAILVSVLMHLTVEDTS